MKNIFTLLFFILILSCKSNTKSNEIADNPDPSLIGTGTKARTVNT